MRHTRMSKNTRRQNTDLERKNGNITTVCCCCIMSLLTVGVILGSIAAFVVWIVALVNGKNLKITEKCPDNNLWEWLLVWGILTFVCVGGNSNKKAADSSAGEDVCENSICKMCCYSVIIAGSITMCWWGNEQLEKDNHCIKDNYTDTLFYKSVIVFWWLYFIVLCISVGIIVILILGLILGNCICGRCMSYIYNKDIPTSIVENDLNEEIIPDIAKEEIVIGDSFEV